MNHNSETASPLSIPENRIHAYVIPGVKRDVSKMIRPCTATRDWMDATPARYAYRCIPLTAANTMGWELLNPVDVEISWSGLENGDRLNIKPAKHDPFAPVPHFGSGTVTWYLPFLFRTPPEYGLLISGPANHDKQSITPLDAFVRTDWVPFPFTMNWRITQADTPITFAAGEPICRIMPFPLTLLNEMQMEFHDLGEDPVFMQKVKEWESNRQRNYQKQKEAEASWAAQGKKPELKELWNSQYAKGQGSEIGKIKHQNVYKCHEPDDMRKK
ncbi:DUF6065 family protein [Aliiglaciecola litoralis]